MKTKSFLSIIVMLIIMMSHSLVSTVTAQSPNKMSYQSVIRNTAGGLVFNQSVGIKISILQGIASGTVVYAETFTLSTNANGLVSLEIGTGAIIVGTIAAIDWTNGPYFLKTEIDPTGGVSYTITSVTQFLSVPYSLYAATAGTTSGTAGGDLYGAYPNPTVVGIQSKPVSITSPAVDQVLIWDGVNWTPGANVTGAASGDLSGTYPNPTVVKLQSLPVSATAPATNDALVWNGSSWTPTASSGLGTNYWTLNGSNQIYNNNAGGLVGIGTTVPSEKLEVNGKVKIDTLLTASSPTKTLVTDASKVVQEVNYIDVSHLQDSLNVRYTKSQSDSLFQTNAGMPFLGNTGFNGGWIWEPTNPVVTHYSVESSILIENDTAWMWYRKDADSLVLSYSTNASYSTWSTPQLIMHGYFNCVFKIGSVYYLIIKTGAFTIGDIYMYQSTNRTTWTIMNSGNPIFTQSVNPGDKLYRVYNTSVAVVGTTMHLILQDWSTAGYRAYYTHATISTLSDFTTNLSANPIITGITGDPCLKYVSARNSLMLLSAEPAVAGDLAHSSDLIGRYASLSDNLSLAASWKRMNNFPVISKSNLMCTDPELVETPNKPFKLLLSFNYNQQYLYQAYSSLTLLELFDISIKDVSNVNYPGYTGTPLNQGVYVLGQLAASELLITGRSRLMDKVKLDSIPIVTTPTNLLTQNNGVISQTTNNFQTSLTNPVTTPNNGVSGYIPHYTGAKTIDTTNLYYDALNKIWGFGTTGPSYVLDISNTNYQALRLHRNMYSGGIWLDLALNNAVGEVTTYGRLIALSTDGTNGAEGGTLTFGTMRSGTVTEAMRINNLGNVGIGLTPTALLHLKAGTTGASTAPLKFTSGTNLTTAETGAVEYNGTNLEFTPTGTLRENIHTGGRGNVTLTAGTTTTVTDATAKTTSTIIISPTSLGVIALSPYVSTKSNGSFVITTTTAVGTETLNYLIIN